MKTCCRCGVDKPDGEFYHQANGKVLSGCKDCRREADGQRRRDGDPEKKREAQRLQRARNPETMQKAHRRQRLKRYGLTPAEYEQRLVEQGGRCAICRSEETGVSHHQSFYVDHDHQTGKARGLLCHHCNSALGHAEDSVDRLMAMAAYLLEHSAMRDNTPDPS